MKKTVNACVSVIIIISMLLAYGVVGYAQNSSEAATEFSYDISVVERNGVALNHYLVKRGIPIVDGQVSVSDKFVAVDKVSGEVIPVQTKSLEKHDSGYIHFLMIAFFVDLKPNETREFTLKKTQNPEFLNDIEISENENSITVKNSLLSISVDSGGLNSITYKNSSLLSGNGTNVSYSVQGGERVDVIGKKIKVYESYDNYVTIMTSGASALGMTVEQYYTIYSNSNRISYQKRYILTDGLLSEYIMVDDMRQELILDDGFTQITQDGKDFVNVDENVKLSRGNYISAYNPGKNLTLSIVSKDIDKFIGVAGNLGVSSGFAYDKMNNTIAFSPLVYRTGNDAVYKWYDGICRTFHSDIIVGDGNSNADFNGEYLTQKNPPYISVDPQRFVDTGWIGSTEITPLVQRNIDSIIDIYDQPRLGRLDTRSLTYETASNGMIKGIAQRPGGLEFHHWFGQMLTDSPEYFDIITESCETWSDISVYRGANHEHWGAGRYRNYFNDSMQFENWQCFYTEVSGLYVDYIMTGDPYIYDIIKLHSDYALKVSLYVKDYIANTTMKYGKFLEPGVWEDPKPIPEGFQIVGETLYYIPGFTAILTNTAIRFPVQARAMYGAYRVLEDEKYLGITKGFVEWLDYYQMPNGRFASDYQPDGTPTFHKNDPNHIETSNYIILYGLRAINDIFRMVDKDSRVWEIVDRDKMRKVLVSLADWLIEDLTPAGDTWTMSDPEGGDLNGWRGAGGSISVYGAEILYTAYNETKDIKYLENFLKMTRADKATVESDGIEGEIVEPMFKTVQMSTFYVPFLRENAELVKELGYSDILDIFLNDADLVDGEFKALNPSTPIKGNIWSNGINKTIYMDYENMGADKHYVANINTGDNYLYENVEQTVGSDNLTVLTPSFMPFDNLLGKDKYAALRTKVRVLPGSADVKAEVIKNTDDEILILLQAENGVVNLSLDGVTQAYSFDNNYQVFRNSKVVKFTKGGNLNPVNGAINVTVDFSFGNPAFELEDVKIEERVEPIVHVVSEESGYKPAWVPYSLAEPTHLINPINGKASFTFTVRPLHNMFETIIGHFGTENTIWNSSGIPFFVKFSTGGYITATNGDAYRSVDTIEFKNGEEYNFTVEVDIEGKKYNMYVADSSGKTYTLAKDYAFSATAPEISTIDAVTMIGKPDAMVMTKHSLSK